MKLFIDLNSLLQQNFKNLIDEKKVVVERLKKDIPERDSKNDVSDKIDGFLREFDLVEKKMDESEAQVGDLLNVAEAFDETLNELEKWQPNTTALEEPIGLTKEAVLEQISDLKVS